MKIVEKAVDAVSGIKRYWSRPPKGSYVSYKEIAAYSLGGMGVMFIATLTAYMGLTAANTLIGSVIGLRPLHLQYMAIVQTVLGMFFAMARSQWVDNTKTRFGKFRPFIVFSAAPIVALCVSFLFLDFARFSYFQKVFYSFLFTTAFAFINPLLADTYTELGTVISPDSNERGKVMAIYYMIASFAPTLTNLLIPILSNLTGGFTNIATYRYIVAPVAVLGVVFCIVGAGGSKERTVNSQGYRAKVKMMKGVMQIYKNKYWWLRTISGYATFLENASVVIIAWLFIYGLQNMTAYALLTTVNGTAWGIAIALSPLIIKKIGSRNLVIYYNLLNIVLTALMFFTYRIPVVFFIFNYINLLANGFSVVTGPVMHSEVKDYQQYISEVRMDFTFGTAGNISIPITLLSGLLLPFVYEAFGLTNNYDVLFDPLVRNSLFSFLCLLSVIGAVLNVLPLLFYDLTASKHKNIVKVLKVRAMFEDFGNGCLKPETLKDTVDGIREAQAVLMQEKPEIGKKTETLKALFSRRDIPVQERAGEITRITQEIKSDKKIIEAIESAKILTDELTRYETPVMREKIRLARELLNKPYEELISYKDAAPFEEYGKEFCDDMKKRHKALLKMAVRLKKSYPNGIKEPDSRAFDAAQAMPADNAKQRKEKRRIIKTLEREWSRYYSAAEPLVEAKKLVFMADCYGRYAEIEAMYADAAVELERIEQEEKLKAEKKAEARKEIADAVKKQRENRKKAAAADTEDNK